MRIHSNLVVAAWLMVGATWMVGGSMAVADEAGKDPLKKAGIRLGDPIQHGHMTVYPVVSSQARQADPYITLQEGLSAGTVKVAEMGASSPNAAPAAAQEVRANVQQNAQQNVQQNAAAEQATQSQQADISDQLGSNRSTPIQRSSGNQVNLVRVTNRSKKPLYLMPGEIILGGDQDRAIAEEYVIKPDGKPTEVKVFCVEHGRWGNRSQQDNAVSLALVASNIGAEASTDDVSTQAAKADNDEFIASANVGNRDVRIAVQQHAKQSVVWKEVARLNRKSGAESGSGTYTANFTTKQANEKLQPYRQALRESVAKVNNIVGVVIEIDGRPEAADIFATTPLFKKLWPRLLEGYAVDAVTADVAAKGTKEKPDTDDVSDPVPSAREFLVQVLSNQASAAGGGAHGRSKRVIAFASEQSFTDAFGMVAPLHVAGYSSSGEAAPMETEAVAAPLQQQQQRQ